jgi:hypothetical protein
MLKLMLAADSEVEYRFTGTDTRPNEIVAEAIERAGGIWLTITRTLSHASVLGFHHGDTKGTGAVSVSAW